MKNEWERELANLFLRLSNYVIQIWFFGSLAGWLGEASSRPVGQLLISSCREGPPNVLCVG